MNAQHSTPSPAHRAASRVHRNPFIESLPFAFVMLLALCVTVRGEAVPDFAKDVAPILRKHCTGCHNGEKARGDLDLTSYSTLAQGGESGAAVAAGKAKESLLIQLVKREKKPFMPPGKRERPTAGEIAVLEAWIDAGAPKPAVDTDGLLTVPEIVPRGTPPRPITAAAFSRDDATIALGRFGEVELYSLRAGRVSARIPATAKVNALAYAHDGTFLVVGGGQPGLRGEAVLWRLQDQLEQRRFGGHAENIISLAISRDDRFLATGSYDGEVKLWLIESGEELGSLGGHNAAVFDLAFRSDGRVLASASADSTVKLWDVSTRERLDTFSEATKGVYTVDFSPDGKRIAAAGVESRIRVWDLSESAREGTNSLVYSRYGHEGAILRLRYARDGTQLVTSAEDRTVKLWNAGSLTERFLLPEQPDWPGAVAFSGDSRQVAVACLNGEFQFFDVEHGSLLRYACAAPVEGGVARRAPELLPSPRARQRGWLESAIAAAALAGVGDAPDNADVADGKEKPELERVEPRCVGPAATTRLRLIGKHLAAVARIDLHGAAEGTKARLVPAADGDGAEDDSSVWVEVTVAAKQLPGPIELAATNAAGESNRVKLFVGDLPHFYERDAREDDRLVTKPTSVWGQLESLGDVDEYRLRGEAGETWVFDAEGRRLGSDADLVLTLVDQAGRVIASNNDHGVDQDPLIVHELPASGEYVIRVSDLKQQGSAKHDYRLSVGEMPLITGVFPLTVSSGQESQLELIGYNLPEGLAAAAHPDKPGTTTVEVPVRARETFTVEAYAVDSGVESEPNDDTLAAGRLSVPGAVNGRIWRHGDASNGSMDVDCFRFEAEAGENLVLEVAAAKLGSPIDTKIEILDTEGAAVPQVVLQAVRDSVINFRPIDSRTGGARLDYWEEMELNQYLYMNGEVVRLFRKPRGPDSAWDFYSSGGARRNYFGTSATAHPLHSDCYIVEPHAPGTRLVPNGLPVFKLNYANDDDSERLLGRDSRLLFEAPRSGGYVVRVTDVTGSGSALHAYRLNIRRAVPGFEISAPGKVVLRRGSGTEFEVSAQRRDGFEGAIRVEITGVPEGCTVSTPIVIQAGHRNAVGTAYVLPHAGEDFAAQWKDVKVVASATIGGETVTRTVAAFDDVVIEEEPSIFVSLEAVTTLEERLKQRTWQVLEPAGTLSAGGAELTVDAEGVIAAAGRNPKSDTYTLNFETGSQHIDRLRLDLSPPPGRSTGLGRGDGGTFVLSEISLTAAPRGDPASQVEVAIKGATASVTAEGGDVTAAFDGDTDTGWSVAGDAKEATATFELETAVGFAAGTTLTLTLKQHAGEGNNLARVRVSAHAVPATLRPAKPVELTIAPGETMSAMIRIERLRHDDRVGFDVLNLPHGVIVDNIGLNGVLITPDTVEREIFLTCDAWVPETSRLCFAVSRDQGRPTSLPVLLHVKRPEPVAAK